MGSAFDDDVPGPSHRGMVNEMDTEEELEYEPPLPTQMNIKGGPDVRPFQQDVAEMCAEFLLCLTNELLYLRRVYPARVFQARSMQPYNGQMHRCLAAEVRKYLAAVEKTLTRLIATESLAEFTVRIVNPARLARPLEHYAFRIAFVRRAPARSASKLADEDFDRLAKQMNECVEALRILPYPYDIMAANDVTFDIQLRTTEDGCLAIIRANEEGGLQWTQEVGEEVDVEQPHARQPGIPALRPMKCFDSAFFKFAMLQLNVQTATKS